MQISHLTASLSICATGSRGEMHGLTAAKAGGFAATQAALHTSSVSSESWISNYDFTDVPGDQIMELGNRLLREGKITLDESCIFVNMAGNNDLNKSAGLYSTRYNLISELEQSILFKQQHRREKSFLMEEESLLAKLRSWQGRAANA